MYFEPDCKMTKWKVISTTDYIFRPQSLESMCFFEQTMHYRKCYSKKVKDNNGADEDNNSPLLFSEKHPGHKFICLKKIPRLMVPMSLVMRGNLCILE